MTSSTIIECRQADSKSVYSDGDWENILVEPITIYPGDEIGIKSVFIDTIAQTNQKINIEEDTTISIGMAYYQVDWKIDDKTYEKPLPVVPPNPVLNPDGKIYILSKLHDGNSIPDAIRIIKLNFSQNKYNPLSDWGNVTAQFTYKNINNQDTTTSVKIPDQSGGTPDVVFNVSIICLKDSSGEPQIKCTNLSDIQKNNVNWIDFIDPGAQEPANYQIYDPHIGSVSMTIPKGSYDPDQIIKLLNDEFSQNGANSYVDADSPVSSQLLLNTKDYNSSNDYHMNWTDDTGKYQVATYNNTNFHYIGTNQFSIQYDSAQQRFFFEYLHMPYYNDDNICVQWIESKNPVNKYFLVDKNSGILLNSLEPSSFWQDQLGFNMENILSQFTFVTNAAEKHPLPINTLSNGKNITGGYRGLTSAMIINSSSRTNFDVVPDLKAQKFFTIINDQTTGIYADEPSFQDTDKLPYFLIDIDTVFKSEVLGQNKKNSTIQGIVSRYYSIDSFTSGGAETSIPYVHLSPFPIQLTSLKIRILTPEGDLPEDIGDNNTVFINLVKSKSLRPLALPEKSNSKNEEKDKEE